MDFVERDVNSGEGEVALMRGRIYTVLIGDARRGLDDVAAGRSFEADEAIERFQRQRAVAGGASSGAQTSR